MKKSSWSGPLWLLKMLCAKIDSSTTGINNKLDDVVTFIQNLFSSAASVTGTAADLLNGKTFFSGTSVVTGTMPDNGAVSKTLSAGASYTVPRGYHNGSGTVTANSIASQTQATAAAGDIVSSKTAWVNGSKITGSLADKSGTTVTASAVSSDATYTYLTIPAVGKYNTLSKVKTLNSNLVGFDITKATALELVGENIRGSNMSYGFKLNKGTHNILVARLFSEGGPTFKPRIGFYGLSGNNNSTLTLSNCTILSKTSIGSLTLFKVNVSADNTTVNVTASGIGSDSSYSQNFYIYYD